MTISPIDVRQLGELKSLLEEEFKPLIKTFMLDCEKRLAEILEAYHQGDNATAYTAVHSLKGASANIGATYLTALCYEMQMACREGNISNNEALLRQIEAEYEKVALYLQEHILV